MPKFKKKIVFNKVIVFKGLLLKIIAGNFYIMIKKYNESSSLLFRNPFEVSLEIFTERSVEKGQNCGGIFFFLNNLDIYKKKWKKASVKRNLSEQFEKIKNRLLNKIQLDTRELCVKRGKILKNLKLKIFFEKKLNFKLFHLFYKIPFSLFNRHLILKNRVEFLVDYPELNQEKIIKNFPNILKIGTEIYKKEYRKPFNIEKSRKLIVNLDISYLRNNNLTFISDLYDRKIYQIFLIFNIYKWCCKKKRIFLNILISN